MSAAIAALLALPIMISVTATAGPLRSGCWVIVDAKDEGTLQNAQEVLCVEASGHASIRESGIFGEGVKGCNVVTITSPAGKLLVDVDYRKCTNNTPSHRLTCGAPSASGSYACVNTLTSEKSDDLQVKLAPLPAGQ